VRWLQRLSLRWRAALRRPQVEREMEAELAEHLECETSELMARGVPSTEARQRAVATMGRMDRIKEECRDSRGTAGWEQLKQDIAFGVRLLLKNRTFFGEACFFVGDLLFSVVSGLHNRLPLSGSRSVNPGRTPSHHFDA
jgi:hypothetical protein